MERTKLPARRDCIRQSVSIGGASRLYVDVDSFEAPKEVWLRFKGDGIDSLHTSLLDELAISCASRLQLGESVEEIFEPMLGTKTDPAGPVQGDARIKMCNGVVDFLARYMLVYCVGRDELAHIPRQEGTT